jgi:hypothetical protein
MVAPWSAFWGRNVFADYIPALQPLLASPFFRGAVSGIGAVTTLAGLAELGGLLTTRRTSPDSDLPSDGPRP